MAVTYGFFNSVNGDRRYDADDISNYFLKLISNGVFATPSDAMQVQESAGMTVQVSAGWGFINCKWIDNDAPYLLTLDAADVVLNRIDRVVLRLNASNDVRTMGIVIKKGTPAGDPTAPALTRVTGGIWELSLAQIYIAAGATEITQAEITDERADTSLCGYVTGLIDQIDTTNLFAQYNSAFYAWFNEIKDQVKSTTIVAELTSVYTTTAADETNIPIRVTDYNTTLDILNVYVNGMKLIGGVDYTNDEFYIYLTNPLSVIGTTVNIQVLKSLDTEDAQSVVSLVIQLLQTCITRSEYNNDLNGLKFIKMSEEDYTVLTNKDSNTVYYVYDSKGRITQYMGTVKISASSTTAAAVIGVFDGLNDSVQGVTTVHPAE